MMAAPEYSAGRPPFTVRHAIDASFAVGALLLLWLTGVAWLEKLETREMARRDLQGLAIEATLLEASRAFAAERTFTHLALQARAPMGDEDRRAIAGHRQAADSAFDRALGLLRAGPEALTGKWGLTTATSLYRSLRELRAHVDSQFDVPRARRETAVARAWFPAVTELIAATQRLRAVPHGATDRGLGDSEALRNVLGAVGVAGELAAREAAILGGVITAGEPLALDELLQFPVLRGRLDQAWATVESYPGRRRAEPTVVAEIESVRRDFRDSFERLRAAVIAAGAEGTNYPLTSGEWIERTGAAIATLDRLAEAARVAAGDTLRTTEAEAERDLFLLAVLMAVIVVGGVLAAAVARRWIVVPLTRVSATIKAIAGGEAAMPAGAVGGPGEIGEIIGAVKLFKDAADARTRDLLDGNQALRRLNERLMNETGRLLAQLELVIGDGNGSPTDENGDNEADVGHILIVDPDGRNRGQLSDRLVQAGYEVVEVGGGRRALRAVDAEKFDLVFQHQPTRRENGVDFLDYRAENPRLKGIPVVVIEDIEGSPDSDRWLEAGADDCVPGDCDPALLLTRVAALIERKQLRDRERLYQDRLAVEKVRFEKLVNEMLPPEIVELRKDGRPAEANAGNAFLDSELSQKDRGLRRELEEILADADARFAANKQLTSRNLALLMVQSGRYRFKEPTLRKIIDRRYPALHRLGIVDNIQKEQRIHRPPISRCY